MLARCPLFAFNYISSYWIITHMCLQIRSFNVSCWLTVQTLTLCRSWDHESSLKVKPGSFAVELQSLRTDFFCCVWKSLFFWSRWFQLYSLEKKSELTFNDWHWIHPIGHNTPWSVLESPVSLMCMSLDCRRIMEYLEHITHKFHPEMPQIGIWTFLMRDNNAILPPYCPNVVTWTHLVDIFWKPVSAKHPLSVFMSILKYI